MLDLLMALRATGSNVGAAAPNGRHDVQLLGNLLKRGSFGEPIEGVDYGLLVGHGSKLPFDSP